MPPPKYSAVKQTVFCGPGACTPSPNGNISIPFGLVKTVEHYLEITGILSLLDSFKTKGIPLRKIVVALCVHNLTGNNSMSDCSDWLSDPNVLKELGICGKLSQRTLNRGLTIIGEHFEEIICRLWKGINENFDLEDTDVNVDGSAVTVYGPKSELGGFGYARDKNKGKRQVEFTVAELQTARIPIYGKTFKGNTSDEKQYRTVLPDIFEMLREGSWIVMDNGGASSDILDSIVNRGHKYLTRVKMNLTDDKHISESQGDFEYVEGGVCCLKHVFQSSGRTNYLFFSSDLYVKNAHTAERKVRDMVGVTKNYDNSGKVRKSDFITIKKNHCVDINVSVTVQTKFGYDDEKEINRMIEDEMGPRCGFFKLESSHELTPLEALRKYRKRVTVEHLISSLKRVTGIKPLRVWKKESIDGTLMLGLLSEAVIGMARFNMKSREEKKMIYGKITVIKTKPSGEYIVRSLSHLTLTKVISEKGKNRSIFSNWEPISKEIMDNISRFKGCFT